MEATIGQWLKRRRKALGLSQADLGKLCCCSPATIRKIEAQIRRPSAALAEQMAKHLRIRADQLDAFFKDIRAPHNGAKSLAPHSAFPLARTNIAEAPRLLFGCDHVVSLVRRRVLNEGCRLLTLTGMAGSGKSSIAQQAAWEMLEDFEDGVYFIALDEISTAEQMFASIAKTQDLRSHEPGFSLQKSLLRHFREKHMLLVLDNFEQLTGAAALLADLLNECAWLHCLVTSRIPLAVRREKLQPISLLPTPYAGTLGVDIEAACMSYPSVALFVDRAQSVNPDIVWSGPALEAIGSICRQLDGLPLAIELIAAQCRFFTPEELLAHLQLDERTGHITSQLLNLTAGGAIDLPARQHSLRNAIGSSYSLLSAEEQKLFRQLSVFQGDIDEDIMHNWQRGATDAIGIQTLLHNLTVKNVLYIRRWGDGTHTLVMHNATRAYAKEQLHEHTEYVDAHERHAHVMLRFACIAASHLHGDSRVSWLAHLERQHADLRAALDWYSRSAIINEDGLHLTAALIQFWLQQDHLREGIQRLTDALGRSDADHPIVARLHVGLATIAYAQGDMSFARTHYIAGLRIARHWSDARTAIHAMIPLALIALSKNQLERAYVLARCSLNHSEHSSTQGMIALSTWVLGEIAFRTGNSQLAKYHLSASLELLSESGDQYAKALAIERLGHIEHEIQQHAEAVAHLNSLVASQHFTYSTDFTSVATEWVAETH